MKIKVLRITTLCVLTLCLGFPARAISQRKSDRPLVVMTRNMFFGADFGPVLGATSFEVFLEAVKNTYLSVQQSDIPARAAAVADEIQARQPDLVGLQEVSIWRTGPFGGPATTVTYDALQSLLDELASRGLHYAPIAVLTEFQAEAPSALGINIGFTDRDVILARTDLSTDELKLSNIQAQHFEAQFDFTSPILGEIVVPRGWLSVDGKIRGKNFRFINTHLESFDLDVQEDQSSELILGPANTDLAVVLAGDLNTESASGDPSQNAGYQLIVGSGFVDTWVVAHAGNPGFTWPLHLADLYTPVTPFRRLDLILAKGEVEVLGAELFGNTLADRTPGGLWPSDHAGLASTINLKPLPSAFAFSRVEKPSFRKALVLTRTTHHEKLARAQRAVA